MINELSNQIADLVARVAPSVVQVEGQGRPATGLVYEDDAVVTTARAIGSDEHPRVRRHDGEVLNAGTNGEVVAGKICLQSEGAEIHFRNIRLLPLPDRQR